MDSLKIHSVLQLLDYPINSKGIAIPEQAGFTVEAAAFERDYTGGHIPALS